MAKKYDLYLEEAVLDDLAQDLEHLEMPLSYKAFRLVAGLAILSVLVIAGRLIFLNVVSANFYDERALLNASDIVTIKAERGAILDRFGKPLSLNSPTFSLNLVLSEVLKNETEKDKTTGILESILALPYGEIDNLLKDVNLEKQSTLVVSRNLMVDQVIKIKNLNLPGVQIENDFDRQYKDGEIFSHIIGYTGPVDKNDLAEDPSLPFNETIGKTGLEAVYDKYLRGEDGIVLNYHNAKTQVVGNKLTRKATPGGEIYSTIDSDFERYFYNRLEQGLNNVGSHSGAGVAINPQTGEVLALISLPSFDNNNIKNQNLVDPMKPLFNRVTSGLYSPGSIIKPLVAYAALKENVIDPKTQIYSPGYIDLPNPYNPDKPSRFLDWRPQGWVDMDAAIARSSDVYFYEVGGGFENQKGLGIDKLKEYWDKFGLGKKTGIDLPFEQQGFLPDSATKEESGRGIWRIGDTYNVSIGQGDLLATPIELVNYIAAIANGGKLYQPFLVQKVVSNSGVTLKENKPELLADYSEEAKDLMGIVQQGMIDGVNKWYGTAYSLADLNMPIAAKTGTAQIENNTKTNAFFVGYMPTEQPEIAILILIENAKEGSLNAVPVAKDVMRWYYYNRIQNSNLKN